MELKLEHVSDWRTKTESPELLPRWPRAKRAHSSKHGLLTWDKSKQRPHAERPVPAAAGLYTSDIQDYDFVLKARWHVDEVGRRLPMTSRDVEAESYWNLRETFLKPVERPESQAHVVLSIGHRDGETSQINENVNHCICFIAELEEESGTSGIFFIFISKDSMFSINTQNLHISICKVYW